MTTSQRSKANVPQKAVLLIGEGLGKKDRLFFENWDFRNSPIGVPPDLFDDETGRRLI